MTKIKQLFSILIACAILFGPLAFMVALLFSGSYKAAAFTALVIVLSWVVLVTAGSGDEKPDQ